MSKLYRNPIVTTFPNRVWEAVAIDKNGKNLWASREATEEDQARRQALAIELGMPSEMAKRIFATRAKDSNLQEATIVKARRMYRNLTQKERLELLEQLSEIN